MRIMKALVPFFLLLAAGCAKASPVPASTAEPTVAPTAAPADTAAPTDLPTEKPTSVPQVILTIDYIEEKETAWTVCVDPECTDSSAIDVALTTDHATQGNQALQLNFEKNDKLKAVFYLERPMDLSGGSSVSFDIFHSGTTDGVGFALTTGPDSVWHESDTVPVEQGKPIILTFNLTAGNYKTAATNWEFRSSIADLDNVVRLSIVLYPRKTGFVIVDNIRLNGA